MEEKLFFASDTVVKVGEFASIKMDLKENITFTKPNQFVEFIDEQIKKYSRFNTSNRLCRL